MNKKRKTWWIVGGVLGFFALFVITVFLLDYNSTDAKIEREVAQIVDGHGFELERQSLSTSRRPPLMISRRIFNRAPIDSETADEIVAKLRAVCPIWEYVHESNIDENNETLAIPSGELHDMHIFYPPEQSGGSIAVIWLIPDDKGSERGDDPPTAVLFISKYHRPSLWQRIKGLWPW